MTVRGAFAYRGLSAATSRGLEEGSWTMDFQRWCENRRLRRAIFPGPGLDEVGMALGALAAAVCVWEEMQRRGGLTATLLGALVAWGFYGAYHRFSVLKWRHDEYERKLRENGLGT